MPNRKLLSLGKANIDSVWNCLLYIYILYIIYDNIIIYNIIYNKSTI